MELKLFRHFWGLDEPWETAFPKIKAAGYAGIESGLPDPSDEARFRELLVAYRFSYIAQISTTGRDVVEHVASFHDQLARAAAFNPMLVNCHGGRDAWTAAESQQFYAAVLAAEREAGVAAAHETHRGRILYNPWATPRPAALLPRSQAQLRSQPLGVRLRAAVDLGRRYHRAGRRTLPPSTCPRRL